MQIFDPTINWLDPINRDSPLSRGLKGLWIALPNQPGWGSDTWLDLNDVVNGNHGTLTNMVPSDDWVSDAPDGGYGSLDFDGINDYVNLGTKSNVVNSSKTFTFGVLLKTSQSGVDKYWFSEGNSSNTNPVVGLVLNNNSARLFLRTISGGSNNVFGTKVVNDGNWHLVCGVADGSTITLYVDGVSQGSFSLSALSISDSDFNTSSVGALLRATVGLYADFNCGFAFKSTEALSTTEIRQLYHESLQGFPTLLNRVPTFISVPATTPTTLTVAPVYEPQPFNADINWLDPINRDSPLSRGLKGLWLALPNQPGWGSDTWLDLNDVVNGNHGTLTNMVPSDDWVADAPDGGFASLDFDGTDDYVSVPDSSDYSFPGKLLIAIRVKANSIPPASNGNRQWMLTKGASSNYEWQLSINSFSTNFGKWVFTRYGDINGFTYRERASSTDADTNWTHIIISVSGLSDTPDIYLNGVLDNGTPNNSSTMSSINGTASVLIGDRGDAVDLNWDGLIESVFIYKGVDASDIDPQKLYHESLQGFPTLLNRVPTFISTGTAAAVTRRLTISLFGVGV